MISYTYKTISFRRIIMLFSKKCRCKNCNALFEKTKRYCPYCGEEGGKSDYKRELNRMAMVYGPPKEMFERKRRRRK